MPWSRMPTGFNDCGQAMHQLVTKLFPLCRSITGDGVRQTFDILREHVPVTTHEVPTGTQALDWVVPREWNIRDAYILDEKGSRIVDFRENNLHVVGYSVPVDATVSLAELQVHLHSLEELPHAVPYVTSYYQEQWGFCLPHDQRIQLAEGPYRVVIDSQLTPGSLTYGELIIPGECEQEIFLSTYICHPSMANNELSGPVVTAFLAKWIASRPRRYTYRVVFVPETIGSIVYLSRHLDQMKRHVVAGFNVTCVGDDRTFSYLPSRNGATLADRAALNVLRDAHPSFTKYSYRDRGSDERQYCSPGVDLPVASVMRSKYREYPEYHTSLDDLELVTPAGLQGGFSVLRECLELLERNHVYLATCLGEPQLGRRGLYPSLGTKHSRRAVGDMMDLLAYADGTRDLIALSDAIHVPVRRLYPLVDALVEEGLLAEVDAAGPPA
jgi:aminopeptidase-like protein